MSKNGWILCGGVAAVVIGSLLPWVQVDTGLGGTISASPRGGSVFVFALLAAAALGAGWPALRSRLSKRRWVGLTAAVVLLSIFAITNWSDLGKLEDSYPGQLSAGLGLYLYTVGVVAMWVCVVRLLLTRRRVTPAVT